MLNVFHSVNTTRKGNHNIYASNASDIWENGTVLYIGDSLPTVINVSAVFRYLFYVSSIQELFSNIGVCEIGIVGECSNNKNNARNDYKTRRMYVLINETAMKKVIIIDYSSDSSCVFIFAFIY